MNLPKTTIDWSSSNVLENILLNIKDPLENILSISPDQNAYEFQKVVFSNSREIRDIIEEIMIKLNSNNLNLTFQNKPEIFEIFETNQKVREMCSQNVDTQKIAQTDQRWLINFENETYSCLTKSQLNLYELAYRMAVSERQLHRKIWNLVYLTPNKYIRILKLNKAKKMIESYVDRSISQIAYAVGYNDVHYFSN